MWVFSQKRIKGSRGVAPCTDFYIGAVRVARIVMDKSGGTWRFQLVTSAHAPAYFPSFSAALKELHARLKAPPQETDDAS